jgi:hypothetical protein
MRFSSLALTSILSLAGAAQAAELPMPEASFGQLPLLFEANGGHYDPSVAFVSRAPGYRLFLTPEGMTLALQTVDAAGGENGEPTPRFSAAVTARFVGGNPSPVMQGVDEAPTRIHYLIGNDASAWSIDNRTYTRVQYRELWQGIDLVLYDQAGELEYDFVVAPGADPSRIRMAYDGIEGLEVLPSGALKLATPAGDLIHSAPVIHQPTAHGLEPITGRFVPRSSHEVGFVLDDHDPTRPVVIDPVLVYSTLLGAGSNDLLHDVAVGASGSAVVTGTTLSADLPVSAGALDELYNDQDAFVARLSPDGTALEWCTYLGGSTPIPFAWDHGHAVELDALERPHVTGFTVSSNFPVTLDALKLANGSDFFLHDGFLSVLSADGASLDYSTLLGGSLQDRAYDLSLDAAGAVYVTGESGGAMPMTPNAAQPSKSSGQDAFLYVFTPGAALSYGTYLGGAGSDVGYSVRAGTDGRAYIGGRTDAADFPATFSAFQPAKAALHDAFIARIDPLGGALEYASFLGGDDGDMAFARPALAADGAGKVWLVGGSKSTDYPTTPGALIEADLNPGFNTGVLTCIDTNLPGASGLVFSTLYGGSSVDSLTDVELDADGNAWVLGWTHSDDLPLVDAWDDEWNSVELALACFDPEGALLSSTFFGGQGPEPHGGAELIGGLAIDPDGNLYLTSTTVTEAGRLTTPGALQTTLTGAADGLVARFTPATPTCAIDLGFQGQGDVTMSLCGNAELTPGTFSRLDIEGAKPGSLIYLVASTQMDPTWLPKIDATLVPLPVESLILLVQGPEQDLELYVPGLSGGPFSVFLQAVAADQGGSTPWHTSNALQVDVP